MVFAFVVSPTAAQPGWVTGTTHETPERMESVPVTLGLGTMDQEPPFWDWAITVLSKPEVLAPAWQGESCRTAKQITAGEAPEPTNATGLVAGVSSTATEPLVPAAVQCDNPDAATHETLENRSVSCSGLESATQLVPFHDSMSEPASPVPTAAQALCEVHETLTRSEGLDDEAGLRTMDHELPSNDSVKAVILNFVEVISPSAPTAVQDLGDTHEIPKSVSMF